MRTKDLEQINEIEIISGLASMARKFQRNQEFRAWFMDPFEGWKNRAMPNVDDADPKIINKWIDLGAPGSPPEPAASVGKNNLKNYLSAMNEIALEANLGPDATSAIAKLKELADDPTTAVELLDKREYIAVWETMYTVFLNQKAIADKKTDATGPTPTTDTPDTSAPKFTPLSTDQYAKAYEAMTPEERAALKKTLELIDDRDRLSTGTESVKNYKKKL